MSSAWWRPQAHRANPEGDFQLITMHSKIGQNRRWSGVAREQSVGPGFSPGTGDPCQVGLVLVVMGEALGGFWALGRFGSASNDISLRSSVHRYTPGEVLCILGVSSKSPPCRWFTKYFVHCLQRKVYFAIAAV